MHARTRTSPRSNVCTNHQWIERQSACLPATLATAWLGAAVLSLTWDALGANQASMQYIDLAYRAGVLCRKLTAAVESNTTSVSVDVPAVPDDVPSTNRSASDKDTTSLSIETKLVLSYVGCQVITQRPNEFKYQYQNTTAAAWNRASTLSILPGDVTVTSLRLACGARRMHARQLLQGSSATVASKITLPPGTSTAQATAAAAAFETAAASAFTSGDFASMFGVSDAVVDSSDATSTASSGSNLALGLGLGLGLGIPLVIAIIAFIIYQRRQRQAVGPLRAAVAPGPSSVGTGGAGGEGKVAPAYTHAQEERGGGRREEPAIGVPVAVDGEGGEDGREAWGSLESGEAGRGAAQV
ncbi:hypothetical protein FOA52_000380 [Chlamydomonas sp. UWO 241]|nr:hypothetical protein FOA52_000380 [Chlamydomonas sp. UWO 241]